MAEDFLLENLKDESCVTHSGCLSFKPAKVIKEVLHQQKSLYGSCGLSGYLGLVRMQKIMVFSWYNTLSSIPVLYAHNHFFLCGIHFLHLENKIHTSVKIILSQMKKFSLFIVSSVQIIMGFQKIQHYMFI